MDKKRAFLWAFGLLIFVVILTVATGMRTHEAEKGSWAYEVYGRIYPVGRILSGIIAGGILLCLILNWRAGRKPSKVS